MAQYPVPQELRKVFEQRMFVCMKAACPQEEDQSLRNLVVKFEAEKLYQPFHNNVTEYLEAANRKLTRVSATAEPLVYNAEDAIYQQKRNALAVKYSMPLKATFEGLKKLNATKNSKTILQINSTIQKLLAFFEGKVETKVKIEDLETNTMKCLRAGRQLLQQDKMRQQQQQQQQQAAMVAAPTVVASHAVHNNVAPTVTAPPPAMQTFVKEESKAPVPTPVAAAAPVPVKVERVPSAIPEQRPLPPQIRTKEGMLAAVKNAPEALTSHLYAVLRDQVVPKQLQNVESMAKRREKLRPHLADELDQTIMDVFDAEYEIRLQKKCKVSSEAPECEMAELFSEFKLEMHLHNLGSPKTGEGEFCGLDFQRHLLDVYHRINENALLLRQECKAHDIVVESLKLVPLDIAGMDSKIVQVEGFAADLSALRTEPCLEAALKYQGKTTNVTVPFGYLENSWMEKIK